MKCEWNRQYKCHITSDWHRARECPVKDTRFIEALDLWALTGRTAKTVRLDDTIGTNNAGDYRQAKKADMAVNFENPMLILTLIHTQDFLQRKKAFEDSKTEDDREFKTDYDLEFGSVYMNKYICKNLQAGYKKWKDKEFKVKYNQGVINY